MRHGLIHAGDGFHRHVFPEDAVPTPAPDIKVAPGQEEKEEGWESGARDFFVEGEESSDLLHITIPCIVELSRALRGIDPLYDQHGARPIH